MPTDILGPRRTGMSNRELLTERQVTILEFIREKIDTRGYGPTVREIGKAFNIKSPNGVMCHLKALEKKGLITRENFSARAIQVTDHVPGASRAGIPLLGMVAAGTPIAAVEQSERLNFGDLFNGPDHFALQVRGQSMIEDHIEDGDFVIIRKQDTARSGEKVVVLIDNEATLKRYHSEKGKVSLIPANHTMYPIELKPTSDIKILGTLVGVLRKCG